MAEWQDPQTFAIGLSIVFIIVIALVLSIMIFSREYVKRIKQEQEKLAETKIQHQKNLLNDSVLVQERERTRIAVHQQFPVKNAENSGFFTRWGILRGRYAVLPLNAVANLLRNRLNIKEAILAHC